MPVVLERPALRRARLTRRQGLVCAAAPLAVFLAVALLFGVQYEVNDDALISCIAAGAYGADTVHLCYVNILLGWLLKPFYLLFPALNWYVVLSLGAVLLCFGILARLAAERFGFGPGLCLWGVGMLFAGLDVLHAFQYTKNAAVLAGVGFVLLARSLSSGGRRAGLLGGVLVFFAACLRWESFLVVTLLALPLLAARLLALPQKRPAVSRLLALAAVCLVAFGVNEAAYRLDSGWANWRAYNAARTEVSDHRLQYIDGSLAADYGLTTAEYYLLDSWDYGDTALFPTGRLTQLAEALPHRTVPNALRETLLHLPQWLFATLPGWLLCGAALALALFCRARRTLFCAGATLAVFCGCMWALFYGGRTPWRVEFLLLAPTALFLLALLDGAVPTVPVKPAAFLLAASFVAAFGSYAELYEVSAQYRIDQAPDTPKAQAMEELLADDSGALYLVSTILEDDLAGKNVWAAPDAGRFENLSFLGGWAAQSPLYDAALVARGLAPGTPLVDAVDAEGVYVVDFCGIEDKCTVLSACLGRTVAPVEVRSCPYYTVYRLVTL